MAFKSRRKQTYYFTDDEKTTSPSASGTNAVSVSGSNATGSSPADIDSTDLIKGWGIGHSFAGNYNVTITHNLNIPINKQRVRLQLFAISSNEIQELNWLEGNDGTNFTGFSVVDIDPDSIEVRFRRYWSQTNNWTAFRWRIVVDVEA